MGSHHGSWVTYEGVETGQGSHEDADLQDWEACLAEDSGWGVGCDWDGESGWGEDSDWGDSWGWVRAGGWSLEAWER